MHPIQQIQRRFPLGRGIQNLLLEEKLVYILGAPFTLDLGRYGRLVPLGQDFGPVDALKKPLSLDSLHPQPPPRILLQQPLD